MVKQKIIVKSWYVLIVLSLVIPWSTVSDKRSCPRCNARENDFNDCIHMDHKDLYFLVKLRDGRLTIRTEKDYRRMSGFGGVNERPWTPEFSKKHLNHHKSYEYKLGFQKE